MCACKVNGKQLTVYARELGLGRLCQHNLEHNRYMYLQALSIMTIIGIFLHIKYRKIVGQPVQVH